MGRRRAVARSRSRSAMACTRRSRPRAWALGGRRQDSHTLARALGVLHDDGGHLQARHSTLANDPNGAELHERLADALGRSEGALPLFVVSQKSLTGHAKAARRSSDDGALPAPWDGVIPLNRSLDCVDELRRIFVGA